MSNNDIGTSDNEAQDQTFTQEATDQAEQSEASQEEQVTLSKKDYNELISQRDSNFNKAENAEERLSHLENMAARDRYIENWLETPENKEKYPDVTSEDLQYINSPEEIEAIASRSQRRVEDIRQKELEKIQISNNAPKYTPEEKASRLAKLKEKVSKGEVRDGFDQYVDINLN